MRNPNAVLIFLSLLAYWNVAKASEPASSSVETTEPKPSTSNCLRIEPGAHLHDGFFARSETSLAFYFANVADDARALRRSAIRGIGQSASISVGGTPLRGFVVGGSIWTAIIDPVFVENGMSISPDDDSVKVRLLRLGPFFDWYVDPGRGFHVQAAAAFTVQVETDVKGNAASPAAIGVAFALGGGHEWFISNELSVGLLGRATFGSLVRTPIEGDQRMLFVVPEIGLTATYH